MMMKFTETYNFEEIYRVYTALILAVNTQSICQVKINFGLSFPSGSRGVKND